MKKFLQGFVVIFIIVLVLLGLRWGYYTIVKAQGSGHKAQETRLRVQGSRHKAQGSGFKVQGSGVKGQVSGIVPSLAVFNENHAVEKPGETGIGAVVPWGDKLYAVTYSAHKPQGSSDKLYIIDKKLRMKEYPLSVGGTPANRMIHRESKQLIIGPYFIRENGEIRVISPEEMPGRLTATARHLTDPAHKVYFYTMEEGLYEVDVNTLEVTEINQDGNVMQPPDVAGPLLPGYHGKGAYTAQGHLVVANNGEYRWQTTDESGCLAEWDGKSWKVIERKQFTEVTGPGGLFGNESADDPVWSTGWDEKSLILKLREGGEWFTYRMPKASFTYDGKHGWHTEWPRIRDVGQPDWLMTMHGMFWAFPPHFSLENDSGIHPLSSYLKIIPDFAAWQGYIVMGCDDASMFDNSMVGQPESNFWFVKPEDLSGFGPRDAYGGVWLNEDIRANDCSDPFLTNGFDRIMIFADCADQQDFTLTIERQHPGGNKWGIWRTLEVKDGKATTAVYTLKKSTEWIRFSSDRDLRGTTVHMHLTQAGEQATDASIFASLSRMGDTAIKAGWLRADGGPDGELMIFGTKKERFYMLNKKLSFDYQAHTDESLDIRDKLIPRRDQLSFDQASVIFTDTDGQRWRLPWGTGGYDKWYARFPQRLIREVATERSLLNAGGIFYELPREISGGIKRIKPISTHNRLITDFCSWRGMMVMSGTRPTAEKDDHFYNDNSLGVGVWLGTIDDLWKFGKPTGLGGPWANTEVSAGELSDPYLMLGFDKKTLTLSHDSQESVRFELLADFVGDGHFKLLQSYQVDSGEVRSIQFEDGFSSNWVRLRVDTDCKATAWFEYE
ncbi:MAG: hypothetical protein J7L96_06955 [Bacteroidales bacterium]|nr:hypothetical protein [Bacteroidales bacterium]